MSGFDDDRAFRLELDDEPRRDERPQRRGGAERTLEHLELDLSDLGTLASGASATPPPFEESSFDDAPGGAPTLGQAPWGCSPTSPPAAPEAPLGSGSSFSLSFDSPPPPIPFRTAPTAHRQEAEPPPEAPLVGTAPPSSAREASPPGASAQEPVVRKLSFPSTRLARSVSDRRVTLDSSDELEPPLAAPPLEEPSELSEPEDWPGELPRGPRPPSLREFWGDVLARVRARRTEALLLGSQRASAGRRWAREFRAGLRESKARRALQRGADASGAPESPASQEPIPAQSAPEPRAARSRRPALPGWVRRASGPALTIALAFGVYVVCSHWLGLVASPAASAVDVPELGSLPPTPRDPRPPEQRKKPRPGSAGAVEGPVKGAPVAASGGPQTETIALTPDLAQPGKGGLEVVTSEDELIYVDGVFVGRGPLRRLPVVPGDHEVSIRSGGSERRGTVSVEAGRGTRALFLRAP